jgi:hypothetical protein
MSSREMEVINILGGSQGTIAVVAALFAGFGYSMLQAVSAEQLLASGTRRNNNNCKR